jgi:hypothetical protein
MGKIGINLKIDVTKIDKSKLFEGKNGAKYLDMTVFVNVDEADQYGNNGMITQSKKKDDTENGSILGNCRIFWKEQQKQHQEKQQFNQNNFDDDIPF